MNKLLEKQRKRNKSIERKRSNKRIWQQREGERERGSENGCHILFNATAYFSTQTS